jgi:hypothetical protein
LPPEPDWTLWRRKKSLAPAGNRTLAVQTQITVLKRDTVYTLQGHFEKGIINEIFKMTMDISIKKI